MNNAERRAIHPIGTELAAGPNSYFLCLQSKMSAGLCHQSNHDPRQIPLARRKLRIKCCTEHGICRNTFIQLRLGVHRRAGATNYVVAYQPPP